jgi:hypothetical protein
MTWHGYLLNHTTFTRRIVLLTMAVTVVFTTTFYQTYLLSSLFITYDEPAMTFEQLTAKLETGQMKVMFWEPKSVLEIQMRKLTTFDRFTRTLANNPPLHLTRLNTSVLETLRDQPVAYIEELDMNLVEIIKKYIPYIHTFQKSYYSHLKSEQTLAALPAH